MAKNKDLNDSNEYEEIKDITTTTKDKKTSSYTKPDKQLTQYILVTPMKYALTQPHRN
jgi:hypothetical protein